MVGLLLLPVPGAMGYEAGVERILQGLEQEVAESNLSQFDYDALLQDLDPGIECHELLSKLDALSLTMVDLRQHRCPDPPERFLRRLRIGGGQQWSGSPTQTPMRFDLGLAGKHGQGTAQWLGPELGRRRLILVAGGMESPKVELHAGHFLSGAAWDAPNALRGRSTFLGQKSLTSGGGLWFSGLNSPHGLGARMVGRDWAVSGFGTWNRTLNEPDTLDAVLYGTQAARKVLSFQLEALGQVTRFEPYTAQQSQVVQGGLRIVQDKGWQASWLRSQLKQEANIEGEGEAPWGNFFEAGWHGRSGNHFGNLLVYHAGTDWISPMGGYYGVATEEDTLSRLEFLQGPFQGAQLKARSLLWENTGSGRSSRMDIRMRLLDPGVGEDKGLGDFQMTHIFHSDNWEWRQGASYFLRPDAEYASLLNHLERTFSDWRVRAGYGHKLGSYAGAFPRTLEIKWGHSGKMLEWEAGWKTGDLLRPARTVRYGIYQWWQFSEAGRVSVSVRTDGGPIESDGDLRVSLAWHQLLLH